MSTYLIGDIHGCYDELLALLKQVKFSPIHNTLWLTGDLVSRGPKSLEVLRYVKSLGNSVRLVLGNHDLHLLAVYAKAKNSKPLNYFSSIVKAPDADELVNWLRCQPLLQIDEKRKLIMVHAGITPQWDIQTAKECANDLETILMSDSYYLVFDAIYGNKISNCWSKELKGASRLNFIANVFTRMRYCFPDGRLDMSCKDNPKNAPSLLKPWFNIPSIITTNYNIVFGHWASLSNVGRPNNIYALDTGCCWGGKLTCMRWEDKAYFSQSSSYC